VYCNCTVQKILRRRLSYLVLKAVSNNSNLSRHARAHFRERPNWVTERHSYKHKAELMDDFKCSTKRFADQ
jgi:hypothetical protein